MRHIPSKHGGKRHSGPLPHMQLPAEQVSAPSPQLLPHRPQLLSSLETSRQIPEQHAELPEHVRPQAPQFATELFVSTQVPEQHAPEPQLGPAPHWQTPPVQVSPIAQAGSHGMSVVQVPPRHTSVAEHALPQNPQLAESVSVLTQVIPQHDPPAAQAPAPQRQVPSTQTSSSTQPGSQGGSVHSPSTQASPTAHRLPHPPQASGFVMGSSMHIPSQHSATPVHAGPVPQRQAPPAHTFACGVHAVLQSPQSVKDVSVFTHASPQHVRPPPQGMSGLHCATQELPRQTVPVGQVIGHIGPASGDRGPASTPGPASSMVGPESVSASAPRAQPSALMESATMNNCAREKHKVDGSYRCNCREGL